MFSNTLDAQKKVLLCLFKKVHFYCDTKDAEQAPVQSVAEWLSMVTFCSEVNMRQLKVLHLVRSYLKYFQGGALVIHSISLFP